jgi:hypothetical protein
MAITWCFHHDTLYQHIKTSLIVHLSKGITTFLKHWNRQKGLLVCFGESIGRVDFGWRITHFLILLLVFIHISFAFKIKKWKFYLMIDLWFEWGLRASYSWYWLTYKFEQYIAEPKRNARKAQRNLENLLWLVWLKKEKHLILGFRMQNGRNRKNNVIVCSTASPATCFAEWYMCC